jgi:hypothetical protein
MIGRGIDDRRRNGRLSGLIRSLQFGLNKRVAILAYKDMQPAKSKIIFHGNNS